MAITLQVTPDYLREWVASPNVAGFLKPAGQPSFGSRRIMSHDEEFNAGKGQ
ncbi:MAG: hypothetical protein U1F87_17010 [Kiritimatiellia bacterium]